ncbi:hypothetical protein [Sphingobacterium corticibacterium]|uniref:hypothetical protein n=1 Tax=Sphingobacterium corticibacterium TaxID=2484746 RepID=UPI0013EE9B31|nr:hypothetical protein [Sphingobacterium corticibacterium]
MGRLLQISMLTYVTMLLSSCGIVEGIFKAGMWTGFLIVGAVIALVIWIIVKIVGGGKR